MILLPWFELSILKTRELKKPHFLNKKIYLQLYTNRKYLEYYVILEAMGLPFNLIRIYPMFKFWLKLLQSENSILRAAYDKSYCICENDKQNCQSWTKIC